MKFFCVESVNKEKMGNLRKNRFNPYKNSAGSRLTYLFYKINIYIFLSILK